MSTLDHNPQQTQVQANALQLIQHEMARQHQDSLLSLEINRAVAGQIAQKINSNRSLLMLGMGASHYANRTAEAVYRSIGINAFAVPLSEALYAPLPKGDQVNLVVSQSGESGEAIRYLQQTRDNLFGLTMNPEGTVATTIPSLIGAGGIEKGFAATRSLMVTLALHAAILEALGHPQTQVRQVLAHPSPVDQTGVQAALEVLEPASHLIFSGRAQLQGLAEVSALHAAELARIPALALEGGQFRHGPMELLEPGLGVVLLRADGESAELTQSLVQTCLEAGVQPVLIDPSGGSVIAGAPELRFPALHGLASAIAVLPSLQAILLGLAAARVTDVGQPRRSSKITGERQ